MLSIFIMIITCILKSSDSYYDNHEYPKIKNSVEFKVIGSHGFNKAPSVNRAGKTGKYADRYNIRNLSC